MQRYGYNNPSPEQKSLGLEPLYFDGSRDADRVFVDTLVTDMLGFGIRSTIKIIFQGVGRLFSR